MSEEIKEILDQLKDSIEYPKFEMPTFDGSDFDYVDNDTLLEPDKCKILLDYINNLQNQLQQKENIIKEVREYINDNVMVYAFNDKKFPHWDFNDDNINDILEILDKENRSV